MKLELIGVRLPDSVPKTTSTSTHVPANPPLSMPTDTPTDDPVDFYYRDRHYHCRIRGQGEGQELRIRNQQGHVLSITKGQKIGYLATSSHDRQEVDVSQPFFFHLIKAAKQALATKNRL